MISERRRQKIQSVVNARQRGITVVLEDIHDPHNVAAILRTCDAFGVQEIVCIYEQEKYSNPQRVGRVSSGAANKWLDFTIYRSSTKAVAELKKAGYAIIATTLDVTSVPIFEIDFTTKPVALVFGNEHRGVSDVMCQASDVKIKIPMQGMAQSLNVSVTAALCLYEMTRQRQGSGKAYQLPAREKAKLIKDFLSR